MSVKVAIVYYSSTGTQHAMYQLLEQASVPAGAEVLRRHIAEIAPAEAIAANPEWAAHVEAIKDEPTATADDLVWGDVVLLGSPTRYGNVTSQFQQLIDTTGPAWSQGQLADKVYSAFTSSQTLHGGQESTLLSIYRQVAHWGGIIVPPGYTDPVKFVDGNPYGVSHATGGDNDIPLGTPQLDALDHLAERAISVARRLQAD